MLHKSISSALDFYFQLSSQPYIAYNLYLLVVLYLIWRGYITNNLLFKICLTIAVPYVYGFVAIVIGE